MEAPVCESLPLLPLPALDDLIFALNFFYLENFLEKFFSRYVKIKRFMLSSS